MSYLALYRKYRPVDFDSVYGQEEVVTVIKNAIINNKVSHAYLFSGPRGTGKTTIAKIIARLVNCENLVDGKPCGKCYNCVNFNNSNDVVEIDAASNNGVDEIRELRDKINLVPSNAKYKVYIIDEVHMLTNQAFNALLKTLEEPPAHVIFILATTEPHKIPLTISSRCQKFSFSKIDDLKIVDRIKEIANLEKLDVEEDAFFEIARMADGGMRDAINILDQLVAYSNGKVTLDDVYKVVGTVSYIDLCNLLDNIKNNNKEKIIEFVDYLDKSGKETNRFIGELIIFLKDIIIYKNTKNLSNIRTKNVAIKSICNLLDSNDIYKLIEILNKIQNDIKFSSHSYIILMTSLLKFSDDISNSVSSPEFKSVENNNDGEKSKKIISREIISEKKKINYLSEEEIEIRINNALALANKNVLNMMKEKWNEIDNYMYDSGLSLVSGLLKDTMVVVASEKYVIVASKSASVVDRINENIKEVEKLFSKMFGFNVKVVAITLAKWQKKKEEYILNTKNGIKYSVKNDLDYLENDNVNSKTPVDELIELVGDNMIEYK
ncbi:MAG: DNA polymerase III subunit gamma/tau [Bacilli bacterium]